jgi:hypothetical protein
VGVVLGATVFRSDIAQATGLASSVTVANTANNPVPVHEQGTANTADADLRTAVRYGPTSMVTLVGPARGTLVPTVPPVKTFVITYFTGGRQMPRRTSAIRFSTSTSASARVVAESVR